MPEIMLDPSLRVSAASSVKQEKGGAMPAENFVSILAELDANSLELVAGEADEGERHDPTDAVDDIAAEGTEEDASLDAKFVRALSEIGEDSSFPISLPSVRGSMNEAGKPVVVRGRVEDQDPSITDLQAQEPAERRDKVGDIPESTGEAMRPLQDWAAHEFADDGSRAEALSKEALPKLAAGEAGQNDLSGQAAKAMQPDDLGSPAEVQGRENAVRQAPNVPAADKPKVSHETPMATVQAAELGRMTPAPISGERTASFSEPGMTTIALPLGQSPMTAGRATGVAAIEAPSQDKTALPLPLGPAQNELHGRDERFSERELAQVSRATSQPVIGTNLPAQAGIGLELQKHIRAGKTPPGEDITGSVIDEPLPLSDRALAIGRETAQPLRPAETSLYSGSPQSTALVRQVSEAVRVSSTGQIEIALRPEELGSVRLSLTGADGKMSVIVQADRPETLDLMRRHIETLSQEFRDIGYGDVSFSFHSGGRNHSHTTEGETMPIEMPEPLTAMTPLEGRAMLVSGSGLDIRI